VNFRSAIAALAATAAFALNPLQAQINLPTKSRSARSEPAAEIAMTRETLAKYFEAQKLISKEKNDWKLAKQLLEDRVNLLKSELETLKQKTKEEESKITDADKQRGELAEKNEALKDAAQLQEEKVAVLEKQIQNVAIRFPTPLLEKVKPLCDRIPVPGKEVKQSLAERYVNALRILNEAARFNTDTVLATELRKLGTGKEAEVDVLYLGLGQGFYAGTGETAKYAGAGIAGENGFEWSPQAGAASEIGRAIAIYKGEEVADFVSLPVTIK
jgi:hypothetical protein